MHDLQELVRLHRMGVGAREVARLVGLSPNTERRYRRIFEQAGLLKGAVDDLPSTESLKSAALRQRPRGTTPLHEQSSVQAWEEAIAKWVDAGMTARPIYDRLRLEEEAFKGTYWAVKRMCARLKKAKGISSGDVAIPVDTGAGEVAQVDFGDIGKVICPETNVPRRAYVFVMTLGFSRHMFAKVVFNQKAATWLQVHIEAFEWFGGVPKVVVPDNLKAAVIRAAFSTEDAELNRSYRELARYYGFKIDPTPPYSPQKKGKVESSVKYVKRNALMAREGEDLNDVNRALHRWLTEIAGQRIHGTTGKKPLVHFEDVEQVELLKLPIERFEPVVWRKAKVHKDAHIQFEGRLYSVPWRWVGQQVWVRATPSTVFVSQLDTEPETLEGVPVRHPRRGPGKRSTNEAHLPQGRKDRRHRSQSYWQARAAAVGPQTHHFIEAIFDHDEVLHQLRKVQAIVTLLEGYPKERAEAASRRAYFYGNFSYREVKSILTKALDMEPLPTPMLPARPGHTPRYARNIEELLRTQLEVACESN